MKTSELTGVALDWAVAKCEKLLKHQGGNLELFDMELKAHPSSLGTVFTPSTDWSQAGPIIEREKITIGYHNDGLRCLAIYAHPHSWNTRTQEYGPTPLIAAMRCYVASKLGDEVDVPEELAA